MSVFQAFNTTLSDQDLDFLVGTVSPELKDRYRLKQIISQDMDFRSTFVGDEKVFRRVMDDDEILLKISPKLFFEILLRKTLQDLERSSYTYEKSSRLRIPVFDSHDLASLLSDDSVLIYLANMLSTFTKTESYTLSFRINDGIWYKIRFNDMDIPGLIRFSRSVEGPYRVGLYKRIADVCLFILGIFPEFPEREYRYPFSGKMRPPIPGKSRLSPEKYEEEGRHHYKLAAESLESVDEEASGVLGILHENFDKAKKPLNFLSEHYLHYRKLHVFG